MNKGKVDVLLGLQWGDEGKGKVVDVLTPKYDVVARFQGGPNAGHTLEFEGQKYVLRSIPSGIFQGDKVNIIGNGVVLAPDLFMDEAKALEHRPMWTAISRPTLRLFCRTPLSVPCPASRWNAPPQKPSARCKKRPPNWISRQPPDGVTRCGPFSST